MDLSVLAQEFDQASQKANQGELERFLDSLKNAIRGIGDLNSEDIDSLKILSSKIWNRCVEWSASSVDIGDLNARFRQVSCDCLSLASAGDADPETRHNLVKFYSKAGKMWTDINRFEMAQKCWTNAVENWRVLEIAAKDFDDDEKVSLKISAFSMWTWMLEGTLKREKRYDASTSNTFLDLFEKAREVAANPSQLTYLATLMGNSAVNFMDAHHFNVAQEWLKRALELLPVEKDSATISSFILRLLAKCFSELGDHNMAVKTIEAAFEADPGNIENVEILAAESTEVYEAPKAQEAIFAYFRHEKIDFIREMAFVQRFLLTKKSLLNTSEQVLQSLIKKYPNGGSGEKFQLLYFDQLLEMNLDKAGETVATLSRDFLLGKEVLSVEGLDHVLNSIWNKAQEMINASELENALKLLSTSEQLVLKAAQPQAKARIFRLLAKIFMQMKNYSDALGAALESKAVEPRSLQTLVILYICYLNLHQEKDCALNDYYSVKRDHLAKFLIALDTLIAITSLEAVSLTDILDFCAHQALSSGSLQIAQRAMDFVVSKLDGDLLKRFPKGYYGSALRQLIKITVEVDTERIPISLPRYLEAGLKVAESMEDISFLFDHPINEVLWLSSVAWNQAIKCLNKGDNDLSTSLFQSCVQWTKHLPESVTTLETRTKALFVITQNSVKSFSGSLNPQMLQVVTSQIAECHQLLGKLRSYPDRAEQLHPQAPSEYIQTLSKEINGEDMEMFFELSRMEFEVLAIHGKARLDSLNDQLALLEIPLPRKIELISDLARFAVKVNTNNRSLSVAMLKQALDSCVSARQFSKWCEVNRSLITVAGDREASMGCFQAALDLFKVADIKEFPEQEIQFLVASAFNNGVYYTRLLRYGSAKSWMETALNLVQHYPKKNEGIEAEMHRAYNELLTKHKALETGIAY